MKNEFSESQLNFFGAQPQYRVTERVLVDPNILTTGPQADEAVKDIARVLRKGMLPIVGFMLEPDKGLYLIVNPGEAELLVKIINHPDCVSEKFNFFNYMKQQTYDCWVCEYDDNWEPILTHYCK